ncbi:ion transporter [Henriciella mobilis]|uniref:ion transporter n=1 Tax=Henriciella mobilis TaxID=2305467 RepID=UPI000E67268E|nr:ion transporter [Henriciella mobilis]RIJ14906.1 ion transporter [Henriciella mobilis]RIJ21861.1 ion transporter [Henriciella mobilis]
MSDRKGLNRQLFWLYEGTGTVSFWFRWALLAFDFLTIGYFLWAPFDTRDRGHYTIDYIIGAVIGLDLAARFYIERHKHRFFLKWINWADMVVVVTMIAPLLVSNFAFLRILRAVRAVRAFTFIRRVKGVTPFFQRHERIIDKVTNLIVFVFVTAAIVYATQVGRNQDIHTYVDALYFTVTSLTTTGYGDVLLEGQIGRIVAILVMVLGLSLFLQLLRAIVEPDHKVEQECETCGLTRHDRDAIHCKHCGAPIKIRTEGLS